MLALIPRTHPGHLLQDLLLPLLPPTPSPVCLARWEERQSRSERRAPLGVIVAAGWTRHPVLTLGSQCKCTS